MISVSADIMISAAATHTCTSPHGLWALQSRLHSNPFSHGLPLAERGQTHVLATFCQPAHAAAAFSQAVPVERVRYEGPLRVLVAVGLLARPMGARPFSDAPRHDKTRAQGRWLSGAKAWLHAQRPVAHAVFIGARPDCLIISLLF